MGKNCKSYYVVFAVFLFGFSLVTQAAPTSLTYQGRIIKADGAPLEHSGVSFIFKITDPTGACVIYQEQVNGIDMTNSGGVFDVPIGQGSVSFPTDGSLNILDTFNNNRSYSCSGGSSYTAAVNDGRKLRVQFYDGTGWKTISPDSTIRSVPFAGYSLSAQKLGTNVASDFVLKTGVPTCNSNEFLSWNGTAMVCAPVSGASGGTVTNVSSSNAYLAVANGTSAPTLTLNVGTTVNTVAAGNDSRLSDARVPTGAAGGDLSGTYPNPSVAKIVGKDLIFTSLAADHYLKFDGTNWINTALSISSIPGLSTQLSNKIDQSQMPASCAAGQTLTFFSPTGAWSCTSISIGDSQITYASKTANTFLAAPNGSAGAPTFRTIAVADLPANAYDSIYFKNGGNSFGGTGVLGTNDNNSLSLKTNGVNRMFVDTSGNVGVGATPAMLLDVRRDTNGAEQVRIVNASTGTSAQTYFTLGNDTNPNIASIYLNGGGNTVSPYGANSLVINNGLAYPIVFTTNGTEKMRIASSGNVGIGTVTPSEKLEVVGNAKTLGYNIVQTNNDSAASWNGVAFNRSRGTASVPTASLNADKLGGLAWSGHDGTAYRQSAELGVQQAGATTATNTPGDIYFATATGAALVERMRITSAGNVGVGTTTPAVSLDIGSKTDALRLPNGTTAEQPASPANGMLRYNTSTNFAEVYQNGAWVSLTTSSGGSNVTTNSSGAVTVAAGGTNQNVTIQASGTGVVTSPSVVTLTSGQASTASNNGALVVSGGVGVSGNINAGGNIFSNGSISSGTSMYSPIIYGGTAASGNLTLDSTSDATKGNVLISPNGGNVGIGTSSPGQKLHMVGDGGAAYLQADAYRSNASGGGIISRHARGTVASPAILNSGDITFLLNGSGYDGSAFINSSNIVMAVEGTPAVNNMPGHIRFETTPAGATIPVERLRINSSGNVGIGTSTPATALHVTSASTLPVESDSSSNRAGFTAKNTATSGTDNTVELRLFAWDGTATSEVGQLTASDSLNTSGANAVHLRANRSTGSLLFETAGSNERMRIDSSGNVGIGTASPISLLHVNGGIIRSDLGATGPSLIATGTGSNLQVSHDGTNFLHMYNSGGGNIATAGIQFRNHDDTVANMTITNPGKVGIGTTTPTQMLDVAGTVKSSIGGGTGGAFSAVGTNTSVNITSGTFTGFRLQNLSATAGNHALIQAYDANGNQQGSFGVLYGAHSGGFQADFFIEPRVVSTPSSFVVKSSGNVGIGSSTPAQKLVVNSSGTSEIMISTGNDDSRLYLTDTARSIRGVAGGALTVQTSSTERMRIDGSGNVGIGTTSPGYRFDVNSGGSMGVRLVGSGPDAPVVRYENTSASGGRIYHVGSTDSASAAGNGFSIYDMTATASRFLINPTGYVGIGTSSPQVMLTVDSTAGTVSAPYSTATDKLAVMSTGNAVIQVTTPNTQSGGIYFSDPESRDPGGIAYSHVSDSLIFRANSATRMTLTSSGSLGIGATSPNGQLANTTTNTGDSGTYAAPAGTGINANSINWVGAGAGYIGQFVNSGSAATSNGVHIYTVASDSGSYILNARSNGSSRFLVRADGNVGVGTIAPSEKLHVVGNLRVQGSTDCILGGGSGATNCTSDRRLKTNIKEIPNALEKILSLRGVEFDWNENALSSGRHDIGVIAQEVEKVFPTTVIENPESGYKMVDYAALVSPLIQSTKELYGLCKVSEKQWSSLAVAVDRNTRDIASLQTENAQLKKIVEAVMKENAAIKGRLERIEKALK